MDQQNLIYEYMFFAGTCNTICGIKQPKIALALPMGLYSTSLVTV